MLCVCYVSSHLLTMGAPLAAVAYSSGSSRGTNLTPHLAATYNHHELLHPQQTSVAKISTARCSPLYTIHATYHAGKPYRTAMLSPSLQVYHKSRAFLSRHNSMCSCPIPPAFPSSNNCCMLSQRSMCTVCRITSASQLRRGATAAAAHGA